MALRWAAKSPLLVASGTMAAAALTAIVLSGQQDPSTVLSGQLQPGADSLADRQQEPRPVSGTSRGDGPSADDVAPVVSGPVPETGVGPGAGPAPDAELDTGGGLGGAGLGATLQLSISAALVQLLDGAGSAAPLDRVPGGTAAAGGPSGSVVAPAGTPSVSSTPVDSAPAPSPEPATGPAPPAGEPPPPGGPAPAPPDDGYVDFPAPGPGPVRGHGKVTAPPRPVIEPDHGPKVEPGPPAVGPAGEAPGQGRPPGDRGRRAGDQAPPGLADTPGGERRGG